jgi:penicillin-binding protein 1C
VKFNYRKLAVKAGIVIAVLLAAYMALRLWPYPELEAFLRRPFSTRVYDRNGVLLQIVPLRDGLRREYVPLDALVPGAASVFIAAEDERFYLHPGVDAVSVVRAALQNLLAGRRVSGASTITMQLARIVSGGGGGGFARKAAEALNALRLETRFSKERILEMYLNSTPFGFQTEGLASASRNFFATEADMLSPAQLFCLAVIPRRPALYNPLQNPAECRAAASALQKRFSKSPAGRRKFPALAAITDADWDAAVNSAGRFDYPFEAPHLIRHVLPGGPPQAEVRLSVDINLQRYIEALIAENVGRHGVERLNQGAAVVLDNGTGEALAWVGSASFSARNGGQIDGVLAPNQPGSSMKPFLYALALERGIAPASVLADIPASFGGGEIYIPQNFNNRFNGPVLLRQALASSLNIPAVELLYRLGVKDYGDFLLRLGFDSIGGEEGSAAAGLGLALGTAPVSLLELARAFSAFPNDGTPTKVRFCRQGGADDTALWGDVSPYARTLLRATPSAGVAPPQRPRALARRNLRFRTNSLSKSAALATDSLAGQKRRTQSALNPPEGGPNGTNVFSPDTARVICSFLSDGDARYLGFGRARNFTADFPLIVKTGTANQYQSISALAASRRFTCAVWMGNFSGETVIGKTGSSVPAAIARDSLVFLHRNYPPAPRTGLDFEEPLGLERRRVCAVSGLSPTDACGETLYEYINPDAPPPPCDWHRVENGHVTVSYPARYQNWLLSSRRAGVVEHGASALDIVSPRDGFVFFAAADEDSGGNGAIPVEVTGGASAELEVFYDGARRTVSRPFRFFLPLEQGRHTLSVRCADETRKVEFTVE